MDNVFHKSIWSKVKAGDVVLMIWESLYQIVEIEIKQVSREQSTFDGEMLVIVSFDFWGDHYPRWSFSAGTTVYVQSRL